ncbi:MAG: diguanylate cyclase, partial [Spirochaetota bacterium]|nr:diguanylate cyclase [Spirochaetota bacterium]
MRTPESYKEHLDLLNDLGIIKKLDALESKSRFLDSIIEIVHELNKETHFSKILTFLVRSIFENIKMTRLTIVYSTLVRGQRFQARVYEGLTEDSALSDQIHFEKNSPIIKSIKALKMATHYHHFLNDLPETDDNPLSLLEPDMIIPMKTRNFFIGFLAIGSSDKDSRYTIDEIKYINAVSDFIAKAIEDSRLKKIMTYDGKSLLLSADYFMIQLNHELEKSMRYNLSFCFALGDLDHFSEINESCGYGFGDRIIKYVGSIIAS